MSTIAPAIRTFPPTRRIRVRELRRYWAAIKLDCGHVADVCHDEAPISWRCSACPPVEVRHAG